jgi:cation:H+ antiporter
MISVAAAFGLVIGIVVAVMASRRAVLHALAASEASHVSPALIGMTVMAIGTDLPEIANSIASALSGHGDINVGDSAGSALTQVTLVLAILCIASPPIEADRMTVVALGGLTAGALLVVGAFVADEVFGRWEGAAMVCGWIVAMSLVRRIGIGDVDEPDGVVVRSEGGGRAQAARRVAFRSAARAAAWLALVAVAATIVVQSFVQLTDALGVPELVASSIVLALGTSMPELVVDWTALRHGSVGLAIGDLFGSSFVDATLAVGSGPSIAATVVSSDAAVTCLVAAVGVGLASIVVARRERHRISTAVQLGVVYVAATALLISRAA